MEKNRGSKVIAIVGLVVAVAALSIGFAAFTQNLTISSSAKVTPSDNVLKVLFSSSDGTQAEAPVVANPSTSDDGKTQTGTNATINNNGGVNPTITGLHADFTDKGQTVTYTFYVHNDSEYIAYLRSVAFANAAGSDTYKKCSKGTDTTEAMVTAACADVKLKISVGGTEFTSSNAAVTDSSLAVGAFAPVVVTISYDAAGTSTTPIPDGDFSVAFGDITLGYSSVSA